MNIRDLVGNFEIPFSERLKQLTDKKLELDKLITNDKRLKFDIYHNFCVNLEQMKTDNQKGKEVVLALEVMKIVKRGKRKYTIDLQKVESGNFFVNYFKNSIDISKYNMCSIGINFYHREGYTFKTFILGANKMCKLGVIGEQKYNSFMEHLERNSNGRQ